MAAGPKQHDRAAWVLNLDADLELAARTASVGAAMAPHLARLASSLLAPNDVLVTETSPPGVASGLVGRAFCPTARAIAMLERAGARPEPHPSQDVLREVNGRAFCAALGQTLPGAAFVRELDVATATLARAPVVSSQWRVKRAFGMAGRGQRLIAPGALTDADRAFLRASITADGGVQIEPNVGITRELAIHGLLKRDGTLMLGRLVEQQCDEHGQWISTSLADDVDTETSRAMIDEARRVSAALQSAGYFGPFGVDAFVYRAQGGTLHLQPRSEINARYSMGFAIGFGAVVTSGR